MPDSCTGLNKVADVLALSVFLLLLSAAFPLHAQLASDSNPDQTINVSVSDADKSAPSQAKSVGKKLILPPHVGVGARELRKDTSTGSPSDATPPDFHNGSEEDAVPSPGYYTTDLSNPRSGPVITDMVGHPVYVNTLPARVGSPGTLLRDLGKSRMVHVIDQYVGTDADDRYKVGLGALIVAQVTGPIYDADIQAYVHAVAKLFKQTGYHAEYHVFTGPGQDICFEKSTSPICYSPDNPSTFYFCAYHGSVVFHDIGEVIYSVEPFQNVRGCHVGSPSPNGLVIDSTMSVLSHEYFESITDPDGDAWWDHYGLDLFGYEIGDICQNATFGYPVVKLNGKPYELQAEYSNRYHACAYVP